MPSSEWPTPEAIEAAAQALCAWPTVAVDDREHNTATYMATDALTAAAKASPVILAPKCETCGGKGDNPASVKRRADCLGRQCLAPLR